jgi:DNA-binding transcriptional LysR family regulator
MKYDCNDKRGKVGPAWMKLDLNLLRAFFVLLDEKNVSRAANRLFITRSAMSKALQRMRDALQDPLFVRVGNDLTATPYARMLGDELEQAFKYIDAGLSSKRDFNISEMRGQMTITAPENFAVGTVPKLVAAIGESTSRLSVQSIHLGHDYLDRLADGSVDFAIYFQQDYAREFLVHKLFNTRPVIWCRKGHPVARKEQISLEDICAYRKVVSHVPSIKQGELAPVLKALGLRNLDAEMMIETAHLSVGLMSLCQSDALWVSFDYLFADPVFSNYVQSIPVDHIPMFEKLSFDVCLLQHQITATSPAHKWVVGRMLELFER